MVVIDIGVQHLEIIQVVEYQIPVQQVDDVQRQPMDEHVHRIHNLILQVHHVVHMLGHQHVMIERGVLRHMHSHPVGVYVAQVMFEKDERVQDIQHHLLLDQRSVRH